MTRAAEFTTAILPPGERLPAFRRGAVDYCVDAIGDPAAFEVSWRLLALGDVNITEPVVSPVRYHRTQTMIEQDGRDRISILYLLAGEAEGMIDGRPVSLRPGEAMVFDLLRTLDVSSVGGSVYRIVTLPRYMIDDILPNARFDGHIVAGDRLALAFDHAGDLIDHPNTVTPENIVFHARALRNLIALALLPAYRSVDPADPAAPLLRRISEIVDADPGRDHGIRSMAAALGEDQAQVLAIVSRFGGLDLLVERRRLLIAYRQLSDPGEPASIASIGARAGFGDPSTFSRRFRTMFGCSPRDVRTQNKGQLPIWAGAYHVECNYRRLLVKDG